MNFGRTVILTALPGVRSSSNHGICTRGLTFMRGGQSAPVLSSMKAMGCRGMSDKPPVKPVKPVEVIEDAETLAELAARIDTTLTPEQKEYVEKIKLKMKGANSQRSLYRDVPRVDELKSVGNFSSYLPPNAEELVDWALSHIPKRDGPRRTKHLKRMDARQEQRRADQEKRKREQMAAAERKVQKKKRIYAEVKAIQAQAAEINRLREMKKEAQAARAKAVAEAAARGV